MEKYGVVESEELKKKAETDEHCPACGAKVRKHGNVMTCPNCGTEPFEDEEND